MNKSTHGPAKNCEQMQERRTVSPAVLGMPSVSHGAKLLKATSKEKLELLAKLEVWRKERAEKLARSILARDGKGVVRKLPEGPPKAKPKMNSNASKGTPISVKNHKPKETESVVKRAHQNPDTKVSSKREKLGEVIESQEEMKVLKSAVNPLQSNQTSPSNLPKITVTNENSEESLARDGNNIYEQAPDSSFEVKSNETVKKENTEEESELYVYMAENIETIDLVEEEDTEQRPELSINIAENIEVESVETIDLVEDNINHPSESSAAGMENNEIIELNEKLDMEQPFESSVTVAENIAVAEPMGKLNVDQAPELSPITEENAEVIEPTEKLNTETSESSVALEAVEVAEPVEIVEPAEKPNIEQGRESCTNAVEYIETPQHMKQYEYRTPDTRYRNNFENIGNASFYSTAPNTPMPNFIDESDKENVTPIFGRKIEEKDVKVWLTELHKLITRGKYSVEHCEEWLSAISRKYPHSTQLPIYWECMAAVNGEQCNVNYSEESEEEEDKIQGDDSMLAQLLDNLVLDDKHESLSKTEKGLDKKNIFKSKTVQFALHQKTMKQYDPELGNEISHKVFVATPVRRSARIQTPNKAVVPSLKSLDPEARKKISFQPNEALLTG